MTTTEGGELSLAAAFTHEHHAIDTGIEDYLASADDDPRRRAAPLLDAMAALRRHIYLEEEIVFPHLPPGPLMMPLMVMRREHGELWRRMDALADRLAAPDATTDGLDASCRDLLDLLETHNSKEEPIIYPHLDSDLDDVERARVRDLLADGALPSGWVCQDA
jgi:iron-sulfur cluster repair protein YtfE (RIC family)